MFIDKRSLGHRYIHISTYCKQMGTAGYKRCTWPRYTRIPLTIWVPSVAEAVIAVGRISTVFHLTFRLITIGDHLAF